MKVIFTMREWKTIHTSCGNVQRWYSTARAVGQKRQTGFEGKRIKGCSFGSEVVEEEEEEERTMESRRISPGLLPRVEAMDGKQKVSPGLDWTRTSAAPILATVKYARRTEGGMIISDTVDSHTV
jgi:hypothetical protein